MDVCALRKDRVKKKKRSPYLDTEVNPVWKALAAGVKWPVAQTWLTKKAWKSLFNTYLKCLACQ